MPENRILSLIKFVKEKKYGESLRKGEIYFRPLSEYRNLKENERGDPYEGIYELTNTELTDIRCDHPILGTYNFKPVPGSNYKLAQLNDDPYLNFSIYAITTQIFQDKDYHFVSEKMQEFGEYAVMINNPAAFLNSIFNELNMKKHIFYADIIGYQSYSIKGKLNLSLFDKSDEFKHQEEYRILIKSGINAPITLQIGSIEEYSIMLKSKEIVEMVWEAKRSSNNS